MSDEQSCLEDCERNHLGRQEVQAIVIGRGCVKEACCRLSSHHAFHWLIRCRRLAECIRSLVRAPIDAGVWTNPQPETQLMEVNHELTSMNQSGSRRLMTILAAAGMDLFPLISPLLRRALSIFDAILNLIILKSYGYLDAMRLP